ncbi:response regulator transcription factor [Gorillibacterium sp. CAU 1737]|uniref:response regulator transcription factor n=1 Tax=Gorillibacterium sp. CAU 1737 TaxID=3140362 RepID=UPI0032605880
MSKQKILVVDDEPSISMLLEFNLKQAGYEVRSVADGEAVFEVMPVFRPDLIILDWMLPKANGIQVCRQLRQSGNQVPVLFLTALTDVQDRIAGLDNGADDYMTKPFSPPELVSRIKAILRRTEKNPDRIPEDDLLEAGPLCIKVANREVTLHGDPIDLTPKEFDLLHFLCRHSGKVLTRIQLLHGVWDYHFLGDTRIVDVHISHLRDKIEKNPRQPEYITTVRNVGYKLQGTRRFVPGSWTLKDSSMSALSSEGE